MLSVNFNKELKFTSAVAANITIEQNFIVQDVHYSELRKQLLENGQPLDVNMDEHAGQIIFLDFSIWYVKK